MKKVLLLNLIAWLASGRFTIPLKREKVDKPVTQLQKIHYEKKRLGGVKFEKSLNNIENEIYTAPIWLGTPLQGYPNGKFVFDTTSGYLSVTGVDCVNCTYTYFNSSQSSTYK